ncbi:hypothetical protein FRC10_010107 [Ceratobasidium sp. 414]|nr:hypothetical protein FRC10_010107 [Ceratobasidium sp. 414]
MTFCHDPIRNLIAISFIGEIQIWCLRLDSTRRRRWVLYDTIRYIDNGDDWCATAMVFFGANNRSLCAATFSGFIIWTYADKSFRWHDHDFKAEISHCVVSPDSLSMVASTSDHSILIWPLQAEGPVTSEQRTFDIPTGRSWIEYAESAPLAYFDAKTVVTADPIGNIYVLSLEGQSKHVFPVGENYFICSILVSDPIINIVAIGPVCTTMLIGFTADTVVHRHVAKAWKAQASHPLPRAITQRVMVATPTEAAGTTDKGHPGLETGRSRKPLVFIWWIFTTLTRYFCWRNLLASILILYYHNMLSFDFVCTYNIAYTRLRHRSQPTNLPYALLATCCSPYFVRATVSFASLPVLVL